MAKNQQNQSNNMKDQANNMNNQSGNMKNQANNMNNQSGNMKNQANNMKNQAGNMKNQSNKAQIPPEPAENVKPPIESCKDMRNQQKNGGRSTPNKADAPDGISGNWQ